MTTKISTTCKQCYKTYEVPIQFIGRTIYCKCGNRFKCQKAAPVKTLSHFSGSLGSSTKKLKELKTHKRKPGSRTPTSRTKTFQFQSFRTVLERKYSRHIAGALLFSIALVLVQLITKLPEASPDLPDPKPQPPTTSELIDAALKSVVTLTGNTSQGSGFLFQDSQTIVTNLHVVENQKNMTARFDSGQTVEISGWSAMAPEYDLVILHLAYPVPRQPLSTTSENIKSGMRIFTIGTPAGLGFTVTDGLVSATRNGHELAKVLGTLGMKKNGKSANSKWVQFTAPISSGNSGGPLMLETGGVVGVNTWVLSRHKESPVVQNINFAIHIDHALEIYKKRSRQPQSFNKLPL